MHARLSSQCSPQFCPSSWRRRGQRVHIALQAAIGDILALALTNVQVHTVHGHPDSTVAERIQAVACCPSRVVFMSTYGLGHHHTNPVRTCSVCRLTAASARLRRSWRSDARPSTPCRARTGRGTNPAPAGRPSQTQCTVWQTTGPASDAFVLPSDSCAAEAAAWRSLQSAYG